MSKKIGITVIGYKNINGISQLLNQLNKCDYGSDDILLIISIDYSEDMCVADLANGFTWKYGEKIVKTFSENLGLKRHILHCGAYLEEYDLDAMAVFEDDTLPSRAFYQYMKKAVSYYENDMDIAGIGLYSFAQNSMRNKPFYPLKDKADIYFVKHAVSWGQIWLRKQWREFEIWLSNNEELDFDQVDIPSTIKAWPSDSSWLKFHCAYCMLENKYFVYPYISYATCFNDVGVHTLEKSDAWQVTISNNGCDIFCEISSKEAITYDGYFQNEKICEMIGMKEDLTVDLYGDKAPYLTKYVLSSWKLPFKIIKKWSGELKPIELNILYDLPGSGIYLYDSSEMDVGRETNAIKCYDKSEIIKFREFYGIFNDWMKLKQAGKSLAEYFINRGYSTIAIYGMKELGERLYDELSESQIHVEYVIDRDSNVKFQKCKCFAPEVMLPKVDVIVVTAQSAYKEIRHFLRCKVDYDIVSIRDVIDGV